MLDFFRLVPRKRIVKIRSKKGVIFHNPSGYKKYLFYCGNFVVLIAIGYFCYLYWPLVNSIAIYNKNKNTNTNTEISLMAEMIKKVEVVTETPIQEFSVSIPKIIAFAKIERDVSPFDKNEYLPVLEQNSIAQARGTGLPGEVGKTVYLFAHSTRQGVRMVRNNSVFYLLGKLINDDLVSIRYDGNTYDYRVFGQRVVSANDIEYINYKEEGKELLILQTCWPLGTDWKRLLIFAERV